MSSWQILILVNLQIIIQIVLLLVFHPRIMYKVQSFLSYGPNYPHPVNSADCVGTRRVVSNSAVYEISTNNYLNCAWDQSKQSSAQVVIEL